MDGALCVIVSPEPRLAISCSCGCPKCGGPVLVGVDPAIPGSDFSTVNGMPLAEFQALRDSVAAHQAECSCHPEPDGCNVDIDCEEAHQAAVDSSGQPWHVDPLCKVRPEARA